MNLAGQSGQVVISQKVVFKFLIIFFGKIMEYMYVYDTPAYKKSFWGLHHMRLSRCVLALKKSCFLEVTLDHKVYTVSHRYMLLRPDVYTCMEL